MSEVSNSHTAHTPTNRETSPPQTKIPSSSLDEDLIDSVISIMQSKVDDIDRTILTARELHASIDRTHQHILGQMAVYEEYVEPRMHQGAVLANENILNGKGEGATGEAEKKEWRITAAREEQKERERNERRERWKARLSDLAGI